MNRVTLSLMALVAITALGCGEDHTTTTQGTPTGARPQFRLTTTRLCALVPARDAHLGSVFPQPPPAKVFGTDLGWTYEHNGTITMLFGDSWQRIDNCPLQPNGDDSLATLSVPPDDWPGFTAHTSLPDAECPELTFANNEGGTEFAPIDLRRWDGVRVPLGPLNVPEAAFFDGQREWAVFVISGVFIGGSGQPCSENEATNGAACSTALSPQAAELVCGPITGTPLCLDPSITGEGFEGSRGPGFKEEQASPPLNPRTLEPLNPRTLSTRAFQPLAAAVCGVGPYQCIDPTSTKEGNGRQAYYLHIAERVGPASYITRAMFLTNKYVNLTARTVRAFDPSDASRRDYAPGTGALLMWGRPGFDNQNTDGQEPPYFMYHPLPLEISGDRLAFEPHYLSAVVNGVPAFSSKQNDAVPLYAGEFDPVNHTAVSYLADLNRWLMIFGGSFVGTVSQTQPIPGAMYARFAPQPWGPWTDAVPILTNEQIAQDLVCGIGMPAECLPPPTPPVRPACIEAADPHGGGILYGANIIDALTRTSRPETGRGPAADVFWNVSTWHPYSVVLVKTHIEVE